MPPYSSLALLEPWRWVGVLCSGRLLGEAAYLSSLLFSLPNRKSQYSQTSANPALSLGQQPLLPGLLFVHAGGLEWGRRGEAGQAPAIHGELQDGGKWGCAQYVGGSG